MEKLETNKKDLAKILKVLSSKANEFEKKVDKTIRKALFGYQTDEMVGMYPHDTEITLFTYKNYKGSVLIEYEFIDLTYILYKDNQEILSATKSNDEDIVWDEDNEYVTRPGKPYGYFVGLIASQLDDINVEDNLYNVLKQKQDSIIKDTVSPINYDKGNRLSYNKTVDLGKYHLTLDAVADLMKEGDGESDYISLDVCYTLCNNKNEVIANGVSSEVYIRATGKDIPEDLRQDMPSKAEYAECAEFAFTELLGKLLFTSNFIPQ